MGKNILLVVTSVVVTVAVCAGLFEIFASLNYDSWRAEFVEKNGLYDTLIVPSDNERLVWKYRPSASGETWGTTIQTNAHGFRDRNRSFERPADGLRIAFAGDSVTLGLGVDATATFVTLFENAAAARAAPLSVEALSFAVGGYSAIQVLELMRDDVIPFSPDTAVYVMCMNDFDFVHSSGQIMKYFRKPESFFARFLERVYAKFFSGSYYEYHFRKNRDAVFSEIRKLKAEMEQRDIDFRVAIMPIFDIENVSSTYPVADMHADIVETLNKDDIPIIDLLAVFENAEMPVTDLAFDDVHLTEAGHRLVADALVEEIL